MFVLALISNILYQFFYIFKFVKLMLMNISIVGAGNVATVLAKMCKDKGHNIVQIIARNEGAGRKLAALVDAECINIYNEPNKNIDFCIIAISDGAYTDAEKSNLNFGNIMVAHTAGSISMDAIKTVSTNLGVLYPLQTLRKEMDYFPEIPFLIEANNGTAFNFIEDFALTLSKNVHYVEEEKRFRLHTAAVIVSNFTNYLYGLTESFCKIEEIDFNLLKPLITETATRIKNISPLDVQTGPAIRKDIITLQKHLKILYPYKALKTWYTRFSDGIMNGY